jgi:hypothetical protein
MASGRVQQKESRHEPNTNEDGSEEIVEEMGICRLNVLCTTCRRLFNEEKVRICVQDMNLDSSDFVVPFHASLKDFEQSVQTLVWEELNDHHFFKQENPRSTSMTFRRRGSRSPFSVYFNSYPNPKASEFAIISSSAIRRINCSSLFHGRIHTIFPPRAGPAANIVNLSP